jgi:hypothetical protein
MQPSHATKSGRRYRYYVSASDLVRLDAPAARLPAHDLEQAVRDRLCSFLRSTADLRREFAAEDATELSRISTHCADLAAQLATARQLPSILKRIDLSTSALILTIDRVALASLINLRCEEEAPPITLAAPAVRVRHGKEVRMVLEHPSAASEGVQNPHLVALLTEAAEAKQLVDRSAELSITQIAERSRRCRSYLAKLYRVAHLAPEFAEAIMSGCQPAHISTRMLLNAELPLSWSEQRSVLRLR